MGKLLQRLHDPARSGVYRVARPDEVLDATRAGRPRLSRVSLAGATGKKELLARLAQGLQFPAWFGANWDALEDCLTDLSWLEADDMLRGLCWFYFGGVYDFGLNVECEHRAHP